MTPKVRILWALMASCLLIAGCNDDGTSAEQNDTASETDQIDTASKDDDSDDGGGGGGGGGDGDSDSDSDGDGDGDDDETNVCETVNAGLDRLPTRVMLLQDKSTSMRQDNKWVLAQEAIKKMVEEYGDNIDFGLDLFSITKRLGAGLDMCEVSSSAVLDIGNDNGETIVNILKDDYSPSGATPLLLAIRNYTKDSFAPLFMDKRVDSYLVIISDGMDTCGSDGVFNPDQGASAAELATETTKIRETMGIKTFVIGFGEGAEPEQLDAIAAVGGTVFTEHFDAADGDQLSAALKTIAKTVAVSCQFQVGDIDRSNLDMDLVNISVSGQTIDSEAIPRDDDCAKKTGWTWMDEEKTTIKFCEQACKRLESGDIEQVSIEFACSAEDVIVMMQ